MKPRALSNRPFTIYGLLGCLAVALIGLEGRACADDLPLPPDVKRSELDEPFELILGLQRTDAQAFTTRLSADGVRAFYEQALPKQGWELTSLPWMAQAQQNRDALEQAAKEHPEWQEDPAISQQLHLMRQGVKAYEQHIGRRSLVAARGAERVFLRFEPQGTGALVLLQRWEESSAQAGGLGNLSGTGTGLGAQGPLAGGGQGWPLANPCCDGSQVPDTLRRVPHSVPVYPNGRMIAASSSGTGGAVDAGETYVSSDSIDQVAEFYRRHMAYNGWTPVEMPAPDAALLRQVQGLPADRVRHEVLAFRNRQAICGVIVTQLLGPTEEAFMASLTPEQRAMLPPAVSNRIGTDERTLIAVDYMEMDTSLLGPGGTGLLHGLSQSK